MMKPAELKERIRGVIAFAVTPFNADQDLDIDGLERNIDFLSRSGIDLLVVCGGVGEFYALTEEEFEAVVQAASRANAGRKPLLAGIGFSTRIARDLAERAAKAGVDGLMVNPFYFVSPGDAGIVQHYHELGRATGLGLMAFSNKTAVYGPRILEKLAEVDEVIALKDELGDVRLFIESMARFGDRFAWVNGCAEPLAAPYFGAGAQALTSGIVNFAPQIALDIWSAGTEQRWDDLHALVARTALPLAQLRERRPGYAIAVLKEAMNLMGLAGGTVRTPLSPMTLEDRDDLRTMLVKLDLIGAHA